MKRTTKILASALALALVACISVAGTLAYLTASTGEVVNTFTVGNIDITLTETKQSDGTDLATGEAWSAKIIPGASFTKNPVVTVEDDSEDCYLYICVEDKIANVVPTAAQWDLGDGWTLVPTAADGKVVYRRVVLASDTTKAFNIIKGDTVTVGNLSNQGTDNDIAKLQALGNDATISFKAYAHQYDANGSLLTAANAGALEFFGTTAAE